MKRGDSELLLLIQKNKTWRSIARAIEYNPKYELPLFHPLPKKYPLPMLLQPYGKDGDMHYFYSITNRKISKLFVPEITNKRILGSWRGWLAIININGDNVIRLLNPITMVEMPLPPLSAFPKPVNSEIKCAMNVEKIVVVSSEGVNTQSNCTIVALGISLHFCHIGDESWKRIYPSIASIKDVIEFKGILHAIDFFGTLFEIEISPSTKVTPVAVQLQLGQARDNHYLVESSGDLLLVSRILDEFDLNTKTVGFKVYKLVESQTSYYKTFYSQERQIWYPEQPVRKIWEEIETLHDQMLFVGRNRTLCLDSKLYPGCKGNCIYFADECIAEVLRASGQIVHPHDNGIFHMSDKTVEYFTERLDHMFSMGPIWFSPNPW